MKLTIVVLAAALSACAAWGSEMNEAEIKALEARLQAQYGPTCARQFAKDSESYNYCVVGFYKKERSDRAAALAPLLLQQQAQPVVNQFYQDPNMFKPKGTTCQSIWVGGVVQTVCR